MVARWGKTLPKFCDGWARREFLRAGVLGLGGIGLPHLLQAESQPGGTRRERSVIMVYLPGGPTQHETFDPKPDAPSEIRGPYGAIPTCLPGIVFGEHLPRLAATAQRFSIIRSLVGMENRHESFQCYTGRPGGRPADNEPAGGWPGFGSVVSHVLGPGSTGAPPYVDASPGMSYGPYNNRGLHDASAQRSWPGFTGPAHVPLALAGDIRDDLELQGVTPEDLRARRDLLTSLQSRRSTRFAAAEEHFQQQAFGMLSSSRMAAALDVSQEPAAVRERYGVTQATDPSFGGAPQSGEHLLLARRLVEAGVRCVTVAFGAWDWHANREGNIEHLAKKYLPVFDQALAALLEDLESRGLLEHVSVVVWGEFGRTPRINAKGGRDHWPNTQSVLVAGGGFVGGQVLGATDRSGGEPIERPVHVQEVFASLYHNLGLDVNRIKLPDFNGRPRYLVDDNRQPIRELLIA